MVDTGTGLTILAPSVLMVKVLGPSAEYVGDGIQQWTAKRVQNVNDVFAKAGRKLGPERLEQPGSVPPKILKGILEEAPFCDDELSAEYLGGVLASARTDGSRDDRAITLISLVARLSSYQLRSHYVMYSAAQRMLAGTSSLNLGREDMRRNHATFFLPDSLWCSAMDFSGEERVNQFDSIIDHVIYGLVREELIDNMILGTGSAEFLSQEFHKEFPEAGIVFRLSMLGVELFTGAHCVQGRPAESFLGDSANFEIEQPLAFEGELISMVDLPPSPREEA
jgi:hypothetical protein